MSQLVLFVAVATWVLLCYGVCVVVWTVIFAARMRTGRVVLLPGDYCQFPKKTASNSMVLFESDNPILLWLGSTLHTFDYQFPGDVNYQAGLLVRAGDILRMPPFLETLPGHTVVMLNSPGVIHFHAWHRVMFALSEVITGLVAGFGGLLILITN